MRITCDIARKLPIGLQCHRRHNSTISSLSNAVSQFLSQCETPINSLEAESSVAAWQNFRKMSPTQQHHARHWLTPVHVMESVVPDPTLLEQQWISNRRYPSVVQDSDATSTAIRTAAMPFCQSGVTIWEGGSGHLDFLASLYFSLLEQKIFPRALVGCDINTFMLEKGLGFVRLMHADQRVGAVGSRAELFPDPSWLKEPFLIIYKDLFAVLDPLNFEQLLNNLSSSLQVGGAAVVNLPMTDNDYYYNHVRAARQGLLKRSPKTVTPQNKISDFVQFSQETQDKQIQYSRNFFRPSRIESILDAFCLKTADQPTDSTQHPSMPIVDFQPDGRPVISQEVFEETHKVLAIVRK